MNVEALAIRRYVTWAVQPDDHCFDAGVVGRSDKLAAHDGAGNLLHPAHSSALLLNRI